VTNRLIILPAVLAAAALLTASCGKSNAPAPAESGAAASEPDKTEITLSPAEQTTAGLEIEKAVVSTQPRILQANGRIALADDKTWRVGVRTDGIVIEVYAGLGDLVKKGQILARFHADEVRDTRALYRHALSEAQQAQAVAAQARRNRDRAQRLLDLRAGSKQQVEESDEALALAEAEIRKAEIEIDRTKDVLEDDLRVPAEPRADDPLSDDVPIYAPASGYVIKKNVTPGKTVDRVMDTFVIGDLSQVWMLASVHQESIGSLRVGQPANVTVPGDSSSRFPGRITNLGQEFDPETRLLEVRIELNNPGNRLRPEMLANAEIPIASGESTVTVPSDAIQQVNGQDVVFVQTAPARFATHPVRVGETTAGRTPILEGLKAGDPVVVHGSFILKSRLLKSALESE